MRMAWIGVGLFAAAWAQEPMPQGPHRAVVIGLNRYADVGALQWAEADARSMGALLSRFGWQVRLMVLGTENHEPLTKDDVLGAVLEACKETPSNGTVLVYFAGHGAMVEKRNFLFLRTTKKARLATEGLAVDEILETLAKTSSDGKPRARSVLLLDACRVPSGGRGLGLDAGSWDELVISEGQGAFFATGSGETAEEPRPGQKLEGEEFKNGFFTHYLLQALEASSADTDQDGFISLDEADRYVQKRMSRLRDKSSLRQKPQLRWEGSGRIVLSSLPRDREIPVIEVLEPLPGVQVKEGRVTIRFKVNDRSPLEFVEVRRQGQECKLQEESAQVWSTTPVLNPGTHELKIDAKDRHGNLATHAFRLEVIPLANDPAVSPKPSPTKPEGPPSPSPEARNRTPVPGGSRAISGLSYVGKNFQGFEEYSLNKDPSVILILVPGGRFRMGSEEGDALDGEGPLTDVELSAYLIAKQETTRAHFKMFCSATGRAIQERPAGTDDNHPVVNVTWDDAVAYCEWAGLRLPTEAQWEFAARGSEGRKWPWGSESPDANRRLCNSFGSEDGYAGTAPVGTFLAGAGPFGTMDQAGNVWEWTSDAWLDQHPGGSKKDPERKGEASSYRVYRGGSFRSFAMLLHGSLRIGNSPSFRFDYIGFRPALHLAP